MTPLPRLFVTAALTALIPACAARRQPAPPPPVDAGAAPAVVDAAVDATPPDAALPLTVPEGASARALNPADIERWRTVLGGALAGSGAAGWASAVVVDERVVDRMATGRTTGPASTPMAADRSRPMGTLTGVVTALMIAALVEEGHLDWSAPVTRLRPDWPAAGPLPTVSELACGCYGVAAVPGTLPRTADQVLERLAGHLAAGDTLEAMPTAVLAAAVGYLAARGAPATPIAPAAAYADQLAARVSGPLGLSLTAGEPTAVGVVPVFGPYDGAWASVDDLARLAVALTAHGLTPSGGRVVEDAAIATLLEPFDGQVTSSTRLGLTVEPRGALDLRVGGGPAGRGTTRMVLADRMAWVIRVEGRGEAVDAALSEALDRLLGLRYGLGATRAPAPGPDAGAPPAPLAAPPPAAAPAAPASDRVGGSPPDAGAR